MTADNDPGSIVIYTLIYASKFAADNIAALLEIFELITIGNAEVKREEE